MQLWLSISGLGGDHAQDYPGERLIVCKDPLLAAERAAAQDLWRRRSATWRPRGGHPAAEAACAGEPDRAPRGQVLGRCRVGQRFTIEITDRAFHYHRDAAAIAAEAALDGLYVIRAGVDAAQLSATETVRSPTAGRAERTFAA